MPSPSRPFVAALALGLLTVLTARAEAQFPPTETAQLTTATPESAAFLEIDDEHPDRPRVELFTGWMFASSPALSALEHPVYDVWVLDCLAVSAAAEEVEGEGAEQ